ncbi:MAG: hypothetical protein LKG27_00805 [Clostridiaceae bacterium]|jgi:hypothetical protein|nr:hypothetical protein [Clostridiaceae bacterium]
MQEKIIKKTIKFPLKMLINDRKNAKIQLRTSDGRKIYEITDDILPKEITEHFGNEYWLNYPKLKEIKVNHIANRCDNDKYKDIQNIKISNMGRVEITSTTAGKTKNTQEEEKGGYLKLKGYPIDEFGYIYNMVADTWLVKPKMKAKLIVHHINNDGYDNRPENLIFIPVTIHGTIHHPKES